MWLGGASAFDALFLQLRRSARSASLITAKPQQRSCPACGQEFWHPVNITGAIQERNQESEVGCQNGKLSYLIQMVRRTR